MKSLKSSLSLLLAVVLTLAMLTSAASAIDFIDPDEDVSFTQTFTDGGKGIAGETVYLYRVADTDAALHMTLTDAFKGYPIALGDGLNQEDWLALASTLKGYVHRDGVKPDFAAVTDDNGEAKFTLKPGLYLVFGAMYEYNGYVYSVTPYMLFVPALKADKSAFEYTCSSAFKFDKDEITPEPTQRAVTKVWDDAGFETLRPASITVTLLCDGEVYDTQTIDESMAWRYEWTELESGHEYELVEIAMEHFTTTVTQEGVTFTVTNTYEPDVPPTPPTPSYDSVKVTPAVVKKLAGDTPDKPAVFEFVLATEDSPMPDGSTDNKKTVTISGAGSTDFGEITFDKAGIYTYTVTETDGNVKGYTYDDETYTITYIVTEDGDKLSVRAVVADSKDNEAEYPVFTNKYTTPGEDLPQTGLLWWPVPVLLCAGILLLIIGTVRRRGEQ